MTRVLLSKLLHFTARSSFRSYPFLFVRSTVNRRMSDHMDRTAQSFREPGISEAEVVSIKQASPTVKVLSLKVQDPSFKFKAGQWVDFFIPGIEIFTGFSMCSSPSELHDHQTLNLAVKISDYPPTMWVHNQCAVGSKVHIRVGGDQLIYDPQPGDPPWNVLLIAGGIGINPLISMMHHMSDLHARQRDSPEGYTPGKVHLLYSSSTRNELIFKDTVDELVSKHSPDFCASFFVTRDSEGESAILRRRMNSSDIKTSLESLQGNPLRCYICGPPPMIADMEAYLRDQGVPNKDVFCEKWW